MRYTLRQLEIFLAVAKHQNISHAARHLHMSQSAASEALQQLEHHYEVALFDRSRNRLTLNAVGKSLRSEAENLLIHCQDFDSKLKGHADLGHLKIGASFTIGNHLATQYLAGYLAEYPAANVQMDTANSPEIVARVLNHEIDIGMIEVDAHHPELAFIPWREDNLVVFCAANHPLATKSTLSDSDIKSARWILREPGSGARQTFEKALAGLLPSIDIYLQFKHNEAIKTAVESGLGIGCLSEIVLRKNFANGDLVPLKLAKRSMRRSFYFVLPKNRHTSKSIEAWLRICRETDLTTSTASNGSQHAR